MFLQFELSALEYIKNMIIDQIQWLWDRFRKDPHNAFVFDRIKHFAEQLEEVRRLEK